METRHGNTLPMCSFPETRPASALLWTCLGHKQAASFGRLSQDRVCHFSVLMASLWDKGQGITTRSRSQERLIMSKATERSKPPRPERGLLDLAIGSNCMWNLPDFSFYNQTLNINRIILYVLFRNLPLKNLTINCGVMTVNIIWYFLWLRSISSYRHTIFNHSQPRDT